MNIDWKRLMGALRWAFTNVLAVVGIVGVGVGLFLVVCHVWSMGFVFGLPTTVVVVSVVLAALKYSGKIP